VEVFVTSQVQGVPSFGHTKEEFKVKEFQGLHGSLSFEDLKNLQFQRLLENWWCCCWLRLKIKVIEGIICNHKNL